MYMLIVNLRYTVYYEINKLVSFRMPQPQPQPQPRMYNVVC